jgi:glutathione S-transferase
MLPEAQHDAALAMASHTATDRRLAMLDSPLAHHVFLPGEALGIADCNLAGVLYGSWF